jgi:elongation factor 1-gamma
MSLTLYTDQGNFRAFKALIAAEYNSVTINIPDFKISQDNLTPEFKKKSPLGKVPVLETPSGSIFESNAIARYIARMRRDSELYGVSFFESGQIDSWIDFCSHDIELPATIWFYPVLGFMPYNALATGKAKADLARALTILDNHLLDKTYLVGHKITLADITIISALVYPFKFVCDPQYLSSFTNVVRWFETCVNQKEFVAVVGPVVLAKKELTPKDTAALPNPTVTASPAAPAAPAAAKSDNKKSEENKKPKADKPKVEKPKVEKPKAAEKPKEKPKKKEVEVDDDDDEPLVPVEKKEDHPFKILDKSSPSPFVMDNWKRTYSNCHGDYVGAMQFFWDNFDANGWSIWRGDYMYNEENSVLFMTSNLIGGFMQRTEEIRKWLFGTLTIRGVAGTPGGMKITHYFLIRGQEIKPLIDCNSDAESYKWEKVAVPVSDADKQMVFDYWTADDALLEGEKVLDSRCYK